MSQEGMRAFSTSFKESAVLRLEAGEQVAAVGRDLKVARKLLYEWRAAWRQRGAAGLNRKRGRKPGFARARLASSRWTSIFFAKPCGSSTRWIERPARHPLRGH